MLKHTDTLKRNKTKREAKKKEKKIYTHLTMCDVSSKHVRVHTWNFINVLSECGRFFQR